MECRIKAFSLKPDVVYNCFLMPVLTSTRCCQVRGDGPRNAAKRVREQNPTQSQMDNWLKRAIADSQLGSCPKSHRRFLSGLAAWQDFAKRNLDLHGGRELPPPLDGLLAWSRTFEFEGTFSNYLNFVKLACQLERVPCDVFGASELVRAKRTLRKAEPPRGPKRFIRQGLLQI